MLTPVTFSLSKKRLMLRERAQIWTIAHSDHSIPIFVELIKDYSIEILVDIRRFPTSKIEHFKKEQIVRWLPEYGIEYAWLGEELGGYRKGGYKRHMQPKPFKNVIRRLLEISKQKRICIVCMETNPKYCHRRFISQYLEKGVKIVHILKKGQKSLTV